MQYSEENGRVDCLSLLPGSVHRFGGSGGLSDANGHRLKVPHMGWNCVRQMIMHPLWDGIEDNSRFYFVHSYFVQPGTLDSDETRVAGETQYGNAFASALSRNSLFAVQFHPEKSQHCGLQLLNNFLRWDGAV
jgi:imidazole glycerol-phosphate synthase subunit HisH